MRVFLISVLCSELSYVSSFLIQHLTDVKNVHHNKNLYKRDYFPNTTLFSKTTSTDDMAERFVDNPTFDEQDVAAALVAFQNELMIPRKLIAEKVFESNPKLIEFYSSVDSKAKKETPVRKLRNKVGISRERLRTMLIAHPTLIGKILASSDFSHMKSSEEILQQELEINDKQLKKVHKIAPDVLRRIYRVDLRYKLQFLRQVLEVEKSPDKASNETHSSSNKKTQNNEASTSNAKLQKVILKRPQLLAYSLSNLKSTINFFSEELEFNPENMARMVFTMPLVLTYSVKKNLRPTVEYLKNKIGLTQEQTEKVCCRYPQVLSQSLNNTIVPKVKFLNNVLKLEKRNNNAAVLGPDDAFKTGQHLSSLPRILYLFPPLLWLSEQNMMTKIKFLSKELMLTNDETRNVIITMPQILGLSLECNLRPKIEFFLQDADTVDETSSFVDSDIEADNDYNEAIIGGGGLTREQLKEFVLYQPALLSYSLENRIAPRVKIMRDNDISLQFSPSYVLSMTDKKFEKWLNMQTSSWSISD